jgi:hypothetical protein
MSMHSLGNSGLCKRTRHRPFLEQLDHFRLARNFSMQERSHPGSSESQRKEFFIKNRLSEGAEAGF